MLKGEHRPACCCAQTLRSEVVPHGDTGVNLPVNLKRLILNAQTKFNIKAHRPGFTNLTPMDVVKKVRARVCGVSVVLYFKCMGCVWVPLVS